MTDPGRSELETGGDFEGEDEGDGDEGCFFFPMKWGGPGEEGFLGFRRLERRRLARKAEDDSVTKIAFTRTTRLVSFLFLSAMNE